MNAPEKISLNVYQRLNLARQQFHSLKLEKTGNNKFAGYKYFELGDFLIPALKVFNGCGLCATVSFEADTASMSIRSLDNPQDMMTITSPMGSAALKGCHEVQNIGAVETYQRRYLWVAALEIVEHDAIDASEGVSEKPAERVRLPKLTDEEAAHEYQKWVEIKSICTDEDGHPDNEKIANEWGKLPSNIRSAIKRYGDSLKKPTPQDFAEQA